MRNLRIDSIILCLAITCNSLFSQNHSKCGSPVSFESYCMDACLVCDLNGVSARTLNITPGQMPAGFCTQVQHSMQWLAFIAGSTNLSINVSVSNCNQANGVEMGIYASDDCQTFKLISNCNTNMFANQTWPFSTTEPLKIGCVYYLVFDGNGPNACNVDFVVTAGSTLAPVPNTTNKISGKKLVCKGETVDYMIATIAGACSYEWRVENGTLNFAMDNKAQVTWDQAGLGKICVMGSNQCNSGNEVCLDVEVGEDSPLQEFGPYYVCFGKSYKFNNLFLTAGTWNYFFKNKYGCDSNTTVIIEEYEPIETYIDTFVCYPDSFKIGKNKIDSSGQYKQVLQSKKSPYCDSILYINLQYNKVKSVPNKTNDLSCQDTTSILYADSSQIGPGIQFRKIWLNSLFDTIGIGNQIRINQAGTYFLIVISMVDSIHTCSSVQSIQVKGSKSNPDLVLLDSLLICSGDSLDLNTISFADKNNTNAQYTFYWNKNGAPGTQIVPTTQRLFVDTSIILIARNGTCEDQLIIPVKIQQKEYYQFRDSSFCMGTVLNLLDLNYFKQGQNIGNPLFYFCPQTDSLCFIKDHHIQLNHDTTLYVIPDSSMCQEKTILNIKANPIPVSNLTASQLDVCIGDTLLLMWSKWDSLSQSNLYFNQQKLVLNQGTTVFETSKLDTGFNQFCLTTQRLSCLDSVCLQVKGHANPMDPIPDCYPTDSSILFTWNQFADESYQVEIIQGGNFIKLSDTSIFFPNLMRGETVIIRIHSSTAFCKEKITQIECQSKSCPPLLLSINPIDTICLTGTNQAFQLYATTNPVVQTGYFIWKGPGIVDSLNGTFDPERAGPGNHKISLIFDVNGCKYFDNRVIVVRQNPFSDFIVDTTACQDSSIVIKFTGDHADSSRFQWELDGGNFQFIKPDRELIIQWHQPGIKHLKLALSFNKCFHESFREIEILEHLPKPIIDCETTDSTIVFKWVKTKRVKNYKVLLKEGNNGVLLNDTVYFIRKRFFNDSASIQLILEDEGPCSEVSSDIASCKSPDCPPKNIVVDTSFELCLSKPMSFDLNTWLNDPVKNYQWTGPFIKSGFVNTADLNQGSYQYYLEAIEFGCQYKDSLKLNINPSPEIKEYLITKIPCDPLNQTGTLIFTNINSSRKPVRFAIDGGTFSDNGSFLNILPGKHYFSIKDSLGCITDTSLEWIAPEIPQVDLGPDKEVFKGETVHLKALIHGNYKIISWNTPQNLSCIDCTDPSLVVQQEVILYCLVTNAEACSSIDSIRIRVIDNKAFVPNVFSPNGDQINDIFTVFGNASRIRLLEIFDRWGNRVYSEKDFLPNAISEGWNGRFKDQNCLPGVYVYFAIVAFEKGPDLQFKGTVQLIR